MHDEKPALASVNESHIAGPDAIGMRDRIRSYRTLVAIMGAFWNTLYCINHYGLVFCISTIVCVQGWR